MHGSIGRGMINETTRVKESSLKHKKWLLRLSSYFMIPFCRLWFFIGSYTLFSLFYVSHQSSSNLYDWLFCHYHYWWYMICFFTFQQLTKHIVSWFLKVTTCKMIIILLLVQLFWWLVWYCFSSNQIIAYFALIIDRWIVKKIMTLLSLDCSAYRIEGKRKQSMSIWHCFHI